MGLAGVALTHLLSAGRRDMFDSERSENILTRHPLQGHTKKAPKSCTVAQMSRRLAWWRAAGSPTILELPAGTRASHERLKGDAVPCTANVSS